MTLRCSALMFTWLTHDVMLDSSISLRCTLSLQDEIGSLKSKLEECKTQLQSNEQMIRWLNNQVPLSRSLVATCHSYCITCMRSFRWLQQDLHLSFTVLLRQPSPQAM